MTKEQYQKITAPLREHGKAARLAKRADAALTAAVFLAYPIYLVSLLLHKNPYLARAIIVPLDSFLVLSFARRVINAPRPYEKFGVPPVFPKKSGGKSFPSRHVFSAFLIAATVFYTAPLAGVTLAGIGAALAVLRVLGGVHEPRDVIWGAAIGLACGAVGYWVLQ